MNDRGQQEEVGLTSYSMMQCFKLFPNEQGTNPCTSSIMALEILAKTIRQEKEPRFLKWLFSVVNLTVSGINSNPNSGKIYL